MAKLTMLARISDGLPLCDSIEQSGDVVVDDYIKQARMIFKHLGAHSPLKCTVESAGDYLFHYIIGTNVCYLALCAKAYPRKLAFSYLSDIQKQFEQEYQPEVDTVVRPYPFIRFESAVKKIRKTYQDTRAARNLEKLSSDLHDIQQVMHKTIEDVVGRGEGLAAVSRMSSHLKAESRKYNKAANQLNLQMWLRTWGPVLAVVGFVLMFLVYRLY